MRKPKYRMQYDWFIQRLYGSEKELDKQTAEINRVVVENQHARLGIKSVSLRELDKNPLAALDIIAELEELEKLPVPPQDPVSKAISQLFGPGVFLKSKMRIDLREKQRAFEQNNLPRKYYKRQVPKGWRLLTYMEIMLRDYDPSKSPHCVKRRADYFYPEDPLTGESITVFSRSHSADRRLLKAARAARDGAKINGLENPQDVEWILGYDPCQDPRWKIDIERMDLQELSPLHPVLLEALFTSRDLRPDVINQAADKLLNEGKKRAALKRNLAREKRRNSIAIRHRARLEAQIRANSQYPAQNPAAEWIKPGDHAPSYALTHEACQAAGKYFGPPDYKLEDKAQGVAFVSHEDSAPADEALALTELSAVETEEKREESSQKAAAPQYLCQSLQKDPAGA